MQSKEQDERAKAQREAGDKRDEDMARTHKSYRDAKKQADEVYKEAKKHAVDEQAKKDAEKEHKDALNQAEQDRDASTKEFSAAFNTAWEQVDTDYMEATTKAQEVVDRSREAKVAYKEARKQADREYKEAKKNAVDKQAKKEAGEVHKRALKQAEQEYKMGKDKL